MILTLLQEKNDSISKLPLLTKIKDVRFLGKDVFLISFLFSLRGNSLGIKKCFLFILEEYQEILLCEIKLQCVYVIVKILLFLYR